jgi:hypothetical protein
MGRANLFTIGTLCKDTQLQQHTVCKRAKNVSLRETEFFKVRNLRGLHHIVSLHRRQKGAHIAARPFHLISVSRIFPIDRPFCVPAKAGVRQPELPQAKPGVLRLR